MEYYKQNSVGLYSYIQSGCFFRAACHMAEMKAGKALSIPQINKLWDMAKKLKYIDNHDNVVVSAAIANLAAGLLDLHGKFVEVATFDKQMNWYASIPQSERTADYYIQKIKQNGPSKTHFRNVDKYGDLIWDPHTPDINVQGVYYTICYKYVEK